MFSHEVDVHLDSLHFLSSRFVVVVALLFIICIDFLLLLLLFLFAGRVGVFSVYLYL